MKRGRLRVLLGAAPGVGKTYEMLEEGRRLRDAGRDVVIGDRRDPRPRGDRRAGRGPADRPPPRSSPTAASSSPRWTSTRVLARHPELALVDELAHTNAPGLAQRQALAGRRGAAGCRHRRHHDGERAAHRVAERRRRADHRHRRSARRFRMPSSGPPTRSRSSTSRRSRCATGSRRASSIPRSGSTRRCRTTSASATSRRCASSRCCGSPTRSTARSSSTAPSTASRARGRRASAWSSPSPAARRARR